MPIVWRDVNYDYLKSRLPEYMTPEQYYAFRDHIYSDFSYMHVNDLGCMEFAGGYPGNLHDEINNFSIIAGVVARQQEFDIIHAHDWLTYPAGVHAKMVSGKPLCIHVHATDSTVPVERLTLRFMQWKRTEWTMLIVLCVCPN